tara:strand:+ start:58 stop:585 length:528 start_codon:yes stop_codon:yes gene_type:complete
MSKKLIFKKKNKKNLIRNNFIFLFIIIIMIFYFFYINFKSDYFEINEFKGSFFFIPQDKGGAIISNQDKKSLHIDENKNNNKEIINDSSLSFTIQIYASNSYKEINKYLDKLFKDVSIKKTFNKNDFYIVSFSHNLDFEYLLVYKNFLRRVDANEFCSKNINFFKKCLIVNVKNL